MRKGSDGVYDFDALVPEPRMVRIGGEVVDVSVIPLAVSLQVAKYFDRTQAEMLAAAADDSEGEVLRLMKLVSNVCVLNNPKITVDFLMDNLDFEKAKVFNAFILFPVTEKEPEEGNAVTAELPSSSVESSLKSDISITGPSE